MKKVILTLMTVLTAALLLTGCMTKQVELRMEYDQMNAYLREHDLTAENREKYLGFTSGSGAEFFGGLYDSVMYAVNGLKSGTYPIIGIVSSEKDADGESVAVPADYHVKDVSVISNTFAFKVDTEDGGWAASLKILIAVTATATDAQGNPLTFTDEDGKEATVTYTAIILPAGFSLREYRTSDDPEVSAIPVLTPILHYKQSGDGYVIASVTQNETLPVYSMT